MKNRLVFKADTHEYFFDGVWIPGYSEIAQKMGISDFSMVPENILQRAQNFGTAFHLTVKLLDGDTLDESSVSPELFSLIDAYNKFKQEYFVNIKLEYIEKPVCSFIYRYGCTPDRICYVNGDLSIVEFKTSSTMPKSCALQTAAQEIAAEGFYGIHIKKRYGVHFSLDGKYKVYQYKDKADKQAWFAFLSAYNWLQKNK